MRINSPAVYECKSRGDRGMHRWQRITVKPSKAFCTFCGIVLEGEDADDVFRGVATPLGQVELPH